jgi:regulatory protein
MPSANTRSLKASAIGYLSRREHSRHELQRKLLAAYPDAEPEQVQTLLDALEHEGWLSNARFVQSVLNRRAAQKGTAAILHELRQHGVDDAQLEQASQELQGSELQRAQAVWEKKFGAPPTDQREYARQVRFLMSRGFGADVVRRVVRYT